MRNRNLLLHEWVAAGVALLSLLALLALIPTREIPDLAHLARRAVQNFMALSKMQLAAALGVGLTIQALSRWPRFRDCLKVTGGLKTFARLVRATLPLLLLTIFHQSVPLWQRVFVRPEADAVLSKIDEWLFGGANPTLWLEHLITKPLTEFMWAAYLSWFVAFQGIVFWLALFRPVKEWADMMLATVLTLAVGYVGYILVPAVGPVHAMKAQFTIDLSGSPISNMTNGVVDQFGIWRDAFPSIHVAVSMLLMAYGWRYLGRSSALTTVLGVSIIISTVYLRWHYVIDVLTGATIAVICFWLSPLILTWWSERTMLAAEDAAPPLSAGQKE